MALDLALLAFEQLIVVCRLDVDQQIVRLRRAAYQLVKLELGGDLLAALRVLNHEHHHQRDPSRDRRERRLPRRRKARDAERHQERPDDNSDNHRNASARGEIANDMKDSTEPLVIRWGPHVRAVPALPARWNDYGSDNHCANAMQENFRRARTSIRAM